MMETSANVGANLQNDMSAKALSSWQCSLVAILTNITAVSGKTDKQLVYP